MNETIRVLQSRCSVKHYTDRQVSDEILDTILETGLYAPSGLNNQQVYMVAVRERWLCDLLTQLEMEKPVSRNRETDLEILADSVNPLRLKNNPVAFSRDTLKAMYERILK